jgi:transcriptional regulator with XRE-family HTH domain
MISEFGIFVRKIRINKNDSLRDMAKKLNISAAFLSSMEVGRKTIPIEYIDKIVNLYNLNDGQKDELIDAINKTNNEVNLELDKMNKSQQEVSLIFARKIKTADPKLIEKLKNILNDKN